MSPILGFCVCLYLLSTCSAGPNVHHETPAGGDEILFRCAANKEFNVVVKEVKTPFHLCSSEGGDHFLMAAPTEGLENTFETSLPKAMTTKLKELNALIVGAPARPKRSKPVGHGGFGGGHGGGGHIGGGHIGGGHGGGGHIGGGHGGGHGGGGHIGGGHGGGGHIGGHIGGGHGGGGHGHGHGGHGGYGG